ncbi:hypothetical protein HPP92_002544 [Vanilla planifolia]|uniref:Uncharacterized protein n=1 Tax=Vanilla planifolia TaxID=51239 RepID=A0A835SEV9_VANPL|nr:hypothetical protein HPP92_002544 [Vanilla planifolia]
MARRWILAAVFFLVVLVIAGTLFFPLYFHREHISPSISHNPARPPSSSFSSVPPPSLSPFSNLPTPLVPPLSSPSPSTPPASLLPSSLAPAFFVLGDSTVDSGTNNFLGTLARADRFPYGRDFDTHRPTGRFSNGRIIVDYLAIRLGLPFVPPFLGQVGRVEDMIHGLNYASAAAGIIFSSGYDLGMHISLTQQIQQVSDTFQHFSLILGEEAAADLISRSVFYLSIGSNDFIHYYLSNASGVQDLYKPSEFNRLLVGTVQQELKNLYNGNVRKMVVMGLAPIGCTPHYLWQYGSDDGECVEFINNVVVDFNSAMKNVVNELNKDLPDAKLAFCDAFKASMDIFANHDRYGFVTTTKACCGLGEYGGWIMCLMPRMSCSDASTHVWWDEFHPTEAVNKILADDVWSSKHANICSPMNMEEMVRQGMD